MAQVALALQQRPVHPYATTSIVSLRRAYLTGVYWIASASNADYTFSADGLTTTKRTIVTGGSQAQANIAQASGYFEIKSSNAAVGLTPSGAANNNWIGFIANSIGYHQTGTVYRNNVPFATYATFVAGDIIMVALKGGIVYFGKNGTWQSGTDPSAGTGGIDVSALFSSAVPTTSANDVADFAVGRFTISALAYAIPTGLTAWDGTIPQTLSYAPSGGVQYGGAGSSTKDKTFLPSGGLQSGGSAVLLKIKVPVASGGLQSGGAAVLAKIKSAVAAGGLQTAGSAALAKLKVPTTSGGLQFAGSSTQAKSKAYNPSGGAQFAGTAAWLKIKTPGASGGAQFAGAGAYSLVTATVAFTYQGNGNFTFGGRAQVEPPLLIAKFWNPPPLTGRRMSVSRSR